MSLAERIKERRKQLNLSQAELAALAGMSQMQISRYESGSSEPNANAFTRLARALQTTPDWLLGFSGDASNEISQLSEFEIEALSVLRSKPIKRQPAILEIIRLA